MIKSVFVFVCCMGMLGAAAHHHGRFIPADAGKAQALTLASERVIELPKEFGDWTSVDSQNSDEDAMRRGGAVQFLSRVCKLRGTNETQSVLLLCGKPGPLSVHTPEVCFAGASNAANPDQQRWKPTEDSEFTWQSFTSRVEGQPNLEVAWAWTVDGKWMSPDVPRLTYGREPFLYKLYIVRQHRGRSKPSEEMTALARELIPTLQRTVFAKPRASTNVKESKVETRSESPQAASKSDAERKSP